MGGKSALVDHATGGLRWVTPGLNRVSLYFPGLKEPGVWELSDRRSHTVAMNREDDEQG